MSLDEGVSRFIARIYEAVYGPEDWDRLIRDLMERTGSRFAFVARADLHNQNYSQMHFHGADDRSCIDRIVKEYGSEFLHLDPSLAWAHANPLAGMCESARLMPREEYRQHPYIIWNKSRLGTTHWRVFYTRPVDGLTFALSLHPPAEVGPPPDDTFEFHRLVFEHIENAMRLAARPVDLSSLNDAVFLLDEKSQIMAQSPREEAIVAMSDGLTVSDNRLHLQTTDMTSRLTAAIFAAIGLQTVTGERFIAIRRLSGRRDWLASITPYPGCLSYLATSAPRVMVRLIEADEHSMLGNYCAQLFGLTRREMEIAQAMLLGHSLESLARMMRISSNTARVHLQSIFRKTNTSRQQELLMLLVRFSSPS